MTVQLTLFILTQPIAKSKTLKLHEAFRHLLTLVSQFLSFCKASLVV